MAGRQRTRRAELPFADDVLRWGRIQRAWQKFAAVILAECGDGMSRQAALEDAKRALIHAQEAGPPHKPRTLSEPSDSIAYVTGAAGSAYTSEFGGQS